MTERVLVVHVAGIGDAAVASTVVERFRAERPAAELTWVCGAAAEPLVRLFPGIWRTIGVNQERLFHGNAFVRAGEILRLWRRLVGRGFDSVIVLHPDPRYRALVLPLVGVPKAFLSRARGDGVNPIPGRFLGDEYARLAGVAGHTGPIERRYEMADLRPGFPLDQPTHWPDARRKRVVLVPGGARNPLREDPLRRWPLEHYAAVARALIDAGHEVVVIGAAHDAWVRPVFAGIDVVDRVGGLTLSDTLGLLRGSALVISHDTGPMHLARLVRTPLIALFGPTIPAQVLSLDQTVTVLWGGAHLACRPCFDGRHFARCAANICLASVLPEQVTDAARRILAGHEAR